VLLEVRTYSINDNQAMCLGKLPHLLWQLILLLLLLLLLLLHWWLKWLLLLGLLLLLLLVCADA
jgi:hypothetical protein